MQNGQYFDKEQRTLSAQPNLNWFASSTQDITITAIIVYVPATQRE